MPIVRDLWQSHVSADYVPNWPCPRCGVASLIMVKGSFHTASDAKTKKHCDDDYWESEFTTGRFVCLLQCSKTGCGETCSVAGDFSICVAYEQDEDVYYHSGGPKAINPPPPMIHIPRKCPKEVRSEVEAAFSLFWNDYAASLNRIRNALELVLNDLGIARGKMTNTKPKPGSPPSPPGSPPPKKKLTPLNLHQRIELLEKKKPSLKPICEQMMAVKHLGNAGSHPGVEVEIDDVFDGLDILERVLDEMYSGHPRILTRTVNQINRRKGPRKKER